MMGRSSVTPCPCALHRTSLSCAIAPGQTAKPELCPHRVILSLVVRSSALKAIGAGSAEPRLGNLGTKPKPNHQLGRTEPKLHPPPQACGGTEKEFLPAASTRGCLAREAPPAASRRNRPEDTRASLHSQTDTRTPLQCGLQDLYSGPCHSGTFRGLSAPRSDELGIIVCLW